MTPEAKAWEIVNKISVCDGIDSAWLRFDGAGDIDDLAHNPLAEAIALAIREAVEEAAQIADAYEKENDRPGHYIASGVAKAIASAIRNRSDKVRDIAPSDRITPQEIRAGVKAVRSVLYSNAKRRGRLSPRNHSPAKSSEPA